MKPTISLYHVSGLLPAQYRNDPASKGIAFASHARTKPDKHSLKETDYTTNPILAALISSIPLHNKRWKDASAHQQTFEKLNVQPKLSILSTHSFVRLAHPIDGLNLGGIYLIYKQNAKENTYSFSPNDEPSIPRWVIDPIDIYPGLELELKVCNRGYHRYCIEPGVYKVRGVSIDNLLYNISVTDEKNWSYIYNGDLYLPTQESQESQGA